MKGSWGGGVAVTLDFGGWSPLAAAGTEDACGIASVS